MQHINVLLIDDHKFVTQALVVYIQEYSRAINVIECNNALESIEFAEKNKPDVVIIDLEMPAISGFQLIHKIREVSANSRIIIFTMYAETDKVKMAFERGANAYVTKNSDSKEIIKAIGEVLKGRRFFCEEIKSIFSDTFFSNRHFAADAPVSILTEKEKVVVDLIRNGLTPAEISKKLGISRSTVNVYRFKIMKKLKLKNQAAFFRLMYQSDNNEKQ